MMMTIELHQVLFSNVMNEKPAIAAYLEIPSMLYRAAQGVDPCLYRQGMYADWLHHCVINTCYSDYSRREECTSRLACSRVPVENFLPDGEIPKLVVAVRIF